MNIEQKDVQSEKSAQDYIREENQRLRAEGARKEKAKENLKVLCEKLDQIDLPASINLLFFVFFVWGIHWIITGFKAVSAWEGFDRIFLVVCIIYAAHKLIRIPFAILLELIKINKEQSTLSAE